ncbi:MAG TPA: efflux RND transporter periplasmic adaptor subunit [Blastocatellia bacterium]
MNTQATEERHKRTKRGDAQALFKMPPQRGRRAALVAVALFAIVAIGYFVSTRRGAKDGMAALPDTADAGGAVKFLMEQQWRIRMKLALVEEKAIARQVTATGRVIPAANRHAAVAPAISGLIERGPLPPLGQRVTAGQTVAVLRQIVTAADLSQIRAAQAQARAQDAQVALDAARLDAERRAADGEIEASRVRLEQARREAGRARTLHEQQVLPKQEAERAEATGKTAQADYDAAVQRRKALDNVRAIAPMEAPGDGVNAAHIIRAPITGVVTKVNKNLGEQVAAGEAILEIVNLDVVWVEAPIFERDLGLVTGNGKASFTTPTWPGQEFRGTLLDIGEVIDEQKRTAHVIFSVPNAERALRVGMQADVRIEAGQSVTAMMIPREAVVEDEGKKIVYVLLSGEEFQRREVKLDDEYGEKVAVLEGLKAGERVVTQGALQLKLHELNPGEGPAHTHET